MSNKARNLLSAGTVNVIQSFFDNFLQSNAEMRASAGFKTTITRRAIGKCCDWCSGLCGTFDIDKAPADIYRRHENCTCMVTVHSEKGYTDAWSKKTYKTKQEARKARAKEIEAEQEKSTKKKKSLIQSTLTDTNKIKSSKYREAMRKLDEDPQIVRTIRKEIEDIVIHRSGTEFEDLVFINSITGKALSNKTGFAKMSCKPNNKMKQMLKDAEAYSIIALHNHPHSSPPSFSDIKASIERRYKYGIIAGHNGTIYKYTVEKECNEILVLSAIDKAIDAFYNNQTNKMKESFEELKKIGVNVEIWS